MYINDETRSHRDGIEGKREEKIKNNYVKNENFTERSLTKGISWDRDL